MDDLAKRLNLKVHGADLCPPEHTFHFILEANDLKEITAFFSGIILANNTGRVSSVIPLKEAAAIVIR